MRALFLLLTGCSFVNAQTGWNTVSSFGSNPGNLNMYSYAPATLPVNAPLVVMMHGCTQNAVTAATESGWNTMADRHNFYLVYPEQISANNSSTCFNWFLSGDQSKNQGEALSIKEMVDKMRALYSIDTSRIFVTGLSAGACMSSVMMACYPEIFNKGAIVAGAPYKAATNASGASAVMNGFVSQTPTQWGNLVRNENPAYSGYLPKAAVFHGTSDPVVNINNATELVKQWTDVNGADQTADIITTNFNGNNFVTRSIYNDPQNEPVVETYIVNSFGHAIGLDTGSCYQQCGATGTYAYDINFSYTFWSAYFFGILEPPSGLVISGQDTVCENASGINYIVPNTTGFIYNWTVPPGSGIASGQNTPSLNVNFALSSGNVSVTETDLSGCKNGPVDYFVNVQNCSSGISSVTQENNTYVFYNRNSSLVKVQVEENKTISQVKLFELSGKELKAEVIYSKNSATFAADNLVRGIYLVQFQNGEQLLRKKILIDE
ncbi:MAG: PHB depolymerase family esterase [Bacteroidia bacterium]